MVPVKPEPLTAFLGRHAGETAWLFGKGPSLDLFDFSTAGPIRAAVNDVVGIVPQCTYGFANDSCAGWSDIYPKTGFTLFQPWRTAKSTPAVPCTRHVFTDHADEARWSDSPQDKAANGLAVGNGTISSAIQIFQIMGIAKIVCVGIDGGQRHAARQEWRTRLQNDHWKAYGRFKQAFIQRAREFGIELEFFGANQSPEAKRGNMKIQITRNTFTKGISLSEGEVVELEESEARLIIASGKAVYAPGIETNYDTTPPASALKAAAAAQVETAELHAATTTTKPPARKRTPAKKKA